MSNRPVTFTADRLLHTLQSFPPVNAYVVGFSGGADSTALLHALNSVRSQLGVPLTAVHVNHGLHDDALFWQVKAEDFCRSNDIALVCLKVDPENDSGRGLEAEARHLRYEAITALLNPGDCLLTAHHADDQAETLLLNLMRGSGVDGLSAMPECRPLGQGFLQRPMLQYQKSVLRDYLHENTIEWTEDPSNQYLNHDRNFVRHQIIPLLEKRWPEVSKRLLLTRKAMSDARHLLERLADKYLLQNLIQPFLLNLPTPLLEDSELFKLVIRRWIKQADKASIPAYRLETLYEQVQHATSRHNVKINWSGSTLRLYRQQLWLSGDMAIQPCPATNWPCENNQIDLGNDVGQLMFSFEIDSEPRPGELLRPAGDFFVGNRKSLKASAIGQGIHHKSLKNLFQSANIPVWLRNSIPLCEWDGEVVAMGDWCFSDSFALWMTERNIKLNWWPQNSLLKYIRAQQQDARQ